MPAQLNNLIQHKHIERALKYIAVHGHPTNNNKKIYYIKRNSLVNSHRCTPFGWAIKYKDAKKWIGIKETIRVAYLYAIKEKHAIHFTDNQLRKVEKNGPIWNKARKILEARGFPCKDRRL